VREAGLAETNPHNLAWAKERIREVIGTQLGAKKLSQRKKAARLSGLNSQTAFRVPMVSTPPDAKTPVGGGQMTVTPTRFKTSFRPFGQGGQS
jgi:putative transposase